MANLEDGVAEVLGKIVVGYIKTKVRFLHSFLETLDLFFLVIGLEAVKQDKAEAISHPCLETHGRLAVFELTEVVLVELKIILVGNAVEVESRFPFQIVMLIIDMVGNSACGIEVVAGDLWVTATQSFDYLFI